METRQTNVAIIGAGTAGLNARREAEKAGADWLLVESGPYGTTCARVGCMPSKLLIAAAERAHAVRGADEFGIRVRDDGWEIDDRAVMQRVRDERDRFVDFVVDSTTSLPEQRRIRGRAEFVDTTTLVVDDDLTIDAESVVIATGSSPWIPPQLEPIREHVLVNDDVFELETLPDSIAIAGTGVIALELGQALKRLGVEAHLFNPVDSLGVFTDPAVDARARQIFGDELDLHLEASIVEAEPTERGYELTWTEDGDRRTAVFEEVLSAAGRRPNLDGLNLEATDLPLDDDGVPEYDRQTMQVGDSPVFIAGDAADHRNVLHEASDEGRIAGSNAANYPCVTAGSRRPPLAIVFTHPQMALVGQTWDRLDSDAVAVGDVDYENQGRSRVMDIDEGLVRLYGWKDGCSFAGAEMLAPRAEHTAHLLAWALGQHLGVQQMLEMPFYHPVVEEGLRTGLRDLAEELKIVGRCPPEDCSDSPGT
ncbi:MAG: dihydrolipoyl dehydrogenase [Bradymonadaceae bacterium]